MSGREHPVLCVPTELLESIESFLEGFEDDPDQEGVVEMLAELRGLMA